MIRAWTIPAALLLGCVLPGAFGAEGAPLPPIQKVEIVNRAIHVNGEPFFPIMAWLQGSANFPLLRECGMNATAGANLRRDQGQTLRDYLDLMQKSGLYGIVPYRDDIKGHPVLLGYIHGDEPDLPHDESDADVVAASELRINPQNPLWKLVDGDLSSWTVLDPLEGAAVTINLKQPVTVTSLAVHLTVSNGLSVAREIAFEADGKEILRTAVAPKRGRQQFPLAQPATLRQLTLKVLAAQKGENVWGSLGEIEGFDADGKNVLLAKPRSVPRRMPAETLKDYQHIKEGDPSRPVFMTLTGNFLPFFKKYDEQARKMYPEYIRATDVIGYDIYPIYGWNKPEWLYLVHDATDLLVRMAGPRPVYAWIETSKGSRWTGELERQKDVRPEHIRAEVWMAICRGATIIGYFTHIWKPSYQQFGVPPENRKALREINDQITRLAPAILGNPPKRAVKISCDGGDVKLDVMAKEKDGDLYLFCVNYDERAIPARAIVAVEGLDAGASIEVVDEARSLQSNAGSFADLFAPLAVHIYRLKAR
ncbi:MAG: hypothetical protein N3D11_16970 [Candidatus Sumerlaeia bacterium]|nr:hypothetical protein [Candidatus Sumerlaeia bacterium]